MITVPEYLKPLSFEELSNLITSKNDSEGIELVGLLKDSLSNASCTSCMRNRATAQLRLYVCKNTKYSYEQSTI